MNKEIKKPEIKLMPDMIAKLPDYSGQLEALTEFNLNKKWQAYHTAKMREVLERIRATWYYKGDNKVVDMKIIDQAIQKYCKEV